MSGNILIVDEDAVLKQDLKQKLEADGYCVFCVSNPASAYDFIENQNHVDAILLNTDMDPENGCKHVEHFRKLTDAITLVVSEDKDSSEVIDVLESGADEHIAKPCESDELYARVKASMRRMNGDKTPQAPDEEERADEKKPLSRKVNTVPLRAYEFNGWRLNPDQMRLFSPDNQEVDITPGEFNLLEAFVRRPQRVLSREKLFELTNGEDFDGFDRSVDIKVARLRKKLADDPETSVMIKTVRGAGYMFNADVNIIQESA